MTIARGEETFEIEVQALSDVRGPASVAQTLMPKPRRRACAVSHCAPKEPPRGQATARPKPSRTSARAA